MPGATPGREHGCYLLLPPSRFSLLGPEASVSPPGYGGTAQDTRCGSGWESEAGLPCSHRGLYGESSTRRDAGTVPTSPGGALASSSLGQARRWFWEAGPVGVGAKAACRGGLPKEGPVNSQDGLSVIGGAPLGRRPGEPWHDGPLSQHIALCTNHLLSSFLFVPPPPTPSMSKFFPNHP